MRLCTFKFLFWFLRCFLALVEDTIFLREVTTLLGYSSTPDHFSSNISETNLDNFVQVWIHLWIPRPVPIHPLTKWR